MNLAAYIFHHLCRSILSAQNLSKRTPQVAYPRLMSELFYQCGIIKMIEDAQVSDLLENQRAKFITGYTLANMSMLKETVKVPNNPLLVKKITGPLPENPPMIFDTESKEVVLEYMRMMKEQGVTITKADIAPEPTEDRKRKRVAVSESSKAKAEMVVKEKKKRPLRKMVLQEKDDEETDEEPLASKRKRSEPKAKGVNAEADA
ncbi:hypothetical protein A2U01_0037576, partial [Trifolium medium]|nr:hypothetical protein [Trifolium medium]